MKRDVERQVLKILGPSDLDELLQLYTHLHRNDETLDPGTAQDRWGEILGMPGHTVFGVRLDDELIGSCILQTVPNLTRGGRPYAVMENVVVRADHRARGVGTAMVRSALSEAWKAGCYKVMLLTGTDNRHTRHFYEHAGFDGTAKRGYVAKP
ncbi:GNAT family N-acetyltransferase [Nitriliruptor alkaliphilus]|uniref:GNAT family N-acetyltransferase n=1 Tax=Nitriliruptor alkaliphilus TaxID=427918 RepID=UPI001B806772|nr:GNAT family N-acetyltransferase [Nitriliruptor alkaliphilus]